MIGAASAARLGEDQDGLAVVHEGLCLGEVGRGGTGLDREASRAIRTLPGHDAPPAPGDLGDTIGPEMLDNLIERARDRR